MFRVYHYHFFFHKCDSKFNLRSEKICYIHVRWPCGQEVQCWILITRFVIPVGSSPSNYMWGNSFCLQLAMSLYIGYLVTSCTRMDHWITGTSTVIILFHNYSQKDHIDINKVSLHRRPSQLLTMRHQMVEHPWKTLCIIPFSTALTTTRSVDGSTKMLKQCKNE